MRPDYLRKLWSHSVDSNIVVATMSCYTYFRRTYNIRSSDSSELTMVIIIDAAGVACLCSQFSAKGND